MTQHNHALDTLKAFLNAVIFGPNGPTREYRGKFHPAWARMHQPLCCLHTALLTRSDRLLWTMSRTYGYFGTFGGC